MMPAVRRLVLAAALAAVVVPVALAAPGDPQKKLTKADQAHARTVSLKLSDFGRGWSQEAPSKDNESKPRCSSYNPDQSDLIETGEYDSPNFSVPPGSFVSSSVGVFKTAAMARTGYGRVAVPALPRCFGELFRKGITKPQSATILFAGPLAFPRYGDRSNGYRIRASVKVGTATVPATIDIVLLNRGRIDVAVIFAGIQQPFAPAFERSIVAKLAARAAAAT
jgi:hypothetical protein